MTILKILIAIVVLILFGVLFLLFTSWGNEILVSLVPRPQEPKERPYIVKEVTFPGGEEGVILAGELTMPREGGPLPALIMITGSGPQDRNEEVAGHKPFLVFSDYFTKRGYAVLRYDDRGVAQSSGDFHTATTKDFADDAVATQRWLKNQPNIDPARIGYVGHSEGGYIAPLASMLEKPAFMILLAGPAEKMGVTLLRQNKVIPRFEGKDEAWIKHNLQGLRELLNIFEMSAHPKEAEIRWRERFPYYQKLLGIPADQIENVLKMTPPAWWMWLVKHDPLPPLKAYQGPVLAVFGGKDLQVLAAHNAPLMEKALANEASRVITFANLNHLFQPTETGAISEYWWKSTTFDESAMKAIADWLEGLQSDG